MNNKLNITLYKEDFTELSWFEICSSCEISPDNDEIIIEFNKSDIKAVEY